MEDLDSLEKMESSFFLVIVTFSLGLASVHINR
jgi:hypothetical protein